MVERVDLVLVTAAYTTYSLDGYSYEARTPEVP